MKEIQDLLDLPGQAMQALIRFLHGVGLDAPIWLAYTAILAVLAILVWSAVRRLRAPDAGVMTWIGFAVLALAAVGVIVGLVQPRLNPLPGRVEGRIEAEARADMTVRLQNFLQADVSDRRHVDTQNGGFALHYDGASIEIPRSLVISRPGCREVGIAVVTAELRRGQLGTRNFACTEVR